MDKMELQEQRSAGAKTEGSPPKRGVWKRLPVIVAGSILLGWLLFIGLGHVAESITHESTDNAFLEADVVSVAPRVAGQVKAVHVVQNERVKKGDPLVDIDSRDYEVEVAIKQSALNASKANERVVEASFELLKTQVQSADATAQQAEAEAAADEANAEKANADLKRAEDLSERKIISPQEFDTARTAAAAANASYNAAKQKTASERLKVGAAKAQLEAGRQALERARAQTDESQVDVQQAELNLSYTKVTAPEDGRVTRKAVEPGDYIHVGQRLMALVPNEVWVTANFKETQLKRIRVGQPARIEVDAVAGRTFAGTVQSIQSGSGAAFSLLPPENAVGNFVKVVQRVPVKIVFSEPLGEEQVFGPGMSVVPSVRVASFEFSRSAVAALATLLAAIAGFGWWKLARKNGAAV